MAKLLYNLDLIFESFLAYYIPYEKHSSDFSYSPYIKFIHPLLKKAFVNNS